MSDGTNTPPPEEPDGAEKRSTTEAPFLNRELSWIHYNGRILEEGLRQDLPLLERFRFLSIAVSNFDEFFMVRVAALKRLACAKAGSLVSGTENAGDMDPAELLETLSGMIRPMFSRLYHCLETEIFPGLAQNGLELRRPPFTPDETGYLKPLFMQEIFPALTPLRFGPVRDAKPANGGHPEQERQPPIVSRVLYGAFLLRPAGGTVSGGEGTVPRSAEISAGSKPGESAFCEFISGEFISIVEIPPALDRIIWLGASRGARRWALLDDLLMLWGDAFFPGCEVRERMLFRVHRDADFSVDERRDEDFVEAMEEVLARREHSPVVRMVHSPGSERIPAVIARRLNLDSRDVFSIAGPLNLGTMGSLAEVPGFEALKTKPRKHHRHPGFSEDAPVWDSIQAGDLLLSVPYQSFDPVVRFFEEAASDPQVISIKTTLYRTSGNSPVIRALENAALGGKQVTAVVELKARFDEGRNILWAERLEKAGVIVIYGLARLKVHAKISQVIRRESSGLVRYVHLSTGNYNDKTAKLYSDLSFFTVREDFGADATAFFNMLSGYSTLDSLGSVPGGIQGSGGSQGVLVMAPRHLKRRLIELIDREAKRASQGSPGRIMAKMNALVDPDVSRALYRASQAGVKIILNVRGICILVPGVPGLSENIRVFSIIDHYLEHARICYFHNGGAEEFYISSADWMPRNLERRVELLVPVPDEQVREELRTIFKAYAGDNTQAWDLTGSGEWKRLAPAGEKPFNAQNYLETLAAKAAEQSWKAREDFVVRRSTPAT